MGPRYQEAHETAKGLCGVAVPSASLLDVGYPPQVSEQTATTASAILTILFIGSPESDRGSLAPLGAPSARYILHRSLYAATSREPHFRARD